MTNLTGTCLIEPATIVTAEEFIHIWINSRFIYSHNIVRTFPMVGGYKGHYCWWLGSAEEYVELMREVSRLLKQATEEHEVLPGFLDGAP